jgi:cytochrome P450/nitrite reductase/ring-hydroxylating ferredoxin subunit
MGLASALPNSNGSACSQSAAGVADKAENEMSPENRRLLTGLFDRSGSAKNHATSKPTRIPLVTKASLIRVANIDQVHGDGPHALSAKGFDIVAVRTPAGWRAFEGRCPHQGALLGEGELDGEKLVCRNHHWRFSADSGRREGGPQCLVSCPIAERDGALFIDVSGLSHKSDRTVSNRTLGDLPGPKGLPFLGNLHQLDLTKLHLILERWAAQYGSVYVFRMGSVPVVAVSDPKWCDQVLRARPEIFTRSSQLAPVLSEMGAGGVLSAEGEAWRTQRRLATFALAQRHLRGFYPKLQTVTSRLKNRWERGADAGESLDIVEDLKRFTVDITTLITFGHDVNTIEQQGDVIQRKLELIFPAVTRRLLAFFPIWRVFRLPRDRRLDRALAELRAWLGNLVVAARKRGAAEPQAAEEPSNFLEAMLSARDDQGRPFSDEVIFGNLMTMLLAGEDTTAYTLAWAVHLLCDCPEAVMKLRREADELLGRSDDAADIETPNKLVWAGAVANETMRLRPVAPIVVILEAKVETVIGDLLVPKGTRVAVLMRPAACHPDHFEEPQTFRPQRWLDENSGAHDVTAHIPFGSGPRICPGRVLAMLEMKLLLSMLFKNFEVERIGGVEGVREHFAFTMSPVGLKVRLRRRSMGSIDVDAI